MPLSVIMLNLDRSYVVMKQASLCVLFFCALVGPQKLLATVKRRKLAWSRHVKRHDKGASPKPSMRTTLRVGDTMVGRENAGWTGQRVDIPACARTAHNSLLQKRLEEDISTESFLMSSRRPSHSRDWTVRNERNLHSFGMSPCHICRRSCLDTEIPVCGCCLTVLSSHTYAKGRGNVFTPAYFLCYSHTISLLYRKLTERLLTVRLISDFCTWWTEGRDWWRCLCKPSGLLPPLCSWWSRFMVLLMEESPTAACWAVSRCIRDCLGSWSNFMVKTTRGTDIYGHMSRGPYDTPRQCEESNCQWADTLLLTVCWRGTIFLLLLCMLSMLP